MHGQGGKAHGCQQACHEAMQRHRRPARLAAAIAAIATTACESVTRRTRAIGPYLPRVAKGSEEAAAVRAKGGEEGGSTREVEGRAASEL